MLTHKGKTDSPLEEISQQWQTLLNLAQVLGLEAEPEAASKLTDEEIFSSDKQPIKPRIFPQAIAFVMNYRNSALL